MDILILSILLKKKDRPLTVLVEFKSAKFLTFRCESSAEAVFFSYKHKLLSCLACIQFRGSELRLLLQVTCCVGLQ